jgi:signal transduction histidine kinase
MRVLVVEDHAALAAPLPPILEHEDLRVDPGQRIATRAGQRLALRPKELAVLEYLLAARGRVVPAEELLERVWDEAADPFTTTLKATIGRRLLSIGQEQERLLEALLTLAASERGLDHTEPVDLAAIADDLLLGYRHEAERLDLRVDASVAPAPAVGDRALARRLFANLIDNAVRHNDSRGRIAVETGTRAHRAYLRVANTGPTIPADDLDRLFEPFQRLGVDRTDLANGHHGLGLSIVRAIATAHHASVTARAQPEGGLMIQVDFAAVALGTPGELNPILRRTRDVRASNVTDRVTVV